MAVAKLTGWEDEFELRGPHRTSTENSYALYEALREHGIEANSREDATRIHLADGSQFYVDSGTHEDGAHPELACVERGDPLLATKSRLANRLRLAKVVERANETSGQKPIELFASCDDGDNPWGAQVNFLISASLMNRIDVEFLNRIVESVAATRLPLVGAGRYVFNRQRPNMPTGIPLEIGQRTRRVANNDFRLLDDTASKAIYFRYSDRIAESGMSERSGLLTAGISAMTLAMLEDDVVLADLMFARPTYLRGAISRDLKVSDSYQLENGRTMTAMEHQRELFMRALRYCRAGNNPFANQENLTLFLNSWNESISLFERGDLDSGAGSIDWLKKLDAFSRQADERGVEWSDPSLRDWARVFSHSHHKISTANDSMPGGKLFETAELTAEAEIAPSETRGSGRHYLLERFVGSSEVTVNKFTWQTIELEDAEGRIRNFDLPDPIANTRTRLESLLVGLSDAEVVDFLCSVSPSSSTTPTEIMEATRGVNPLMSDAIAARDQLYANDPEKWIKVRPRLSERFTTPRFSIGDTSFVGIVAGGVGSRVTYIATRQPLSLLRSQLEKPGESELPSAGVDINVDEKDGFMLLKASGGNKTVVLLDFDRKDGGKSWSRLFAESTFSNGSWECSRKTMLDLCDENVRTALVGLERDVPRRSDISIEF